MKCPLYVISLLVLKPLRWCSPPQCDALRWGEPVYINPNCGYSVVWYIGTLMSICFKHAHIFAVVYWFVLFGSFDNFVGAPGMTNDWRCREWSTTSPPLLNMVWLQCNSSGPLVQWFHGSVVCFHQPVIAITGMVPAGGRMYRISSTYSTPPVTTVILYYCVRYKTCCYVIYNNYYVFGFATCIWMYVMCVYCYVYETCIYVLFTKYKTVFYMCLYVWHYSTSSRLHTHLLHTHSFGFLILNIS